MDSLHIIALSVPFVNRFLQSFLSLEIRCVLYKKMGAVFVHNAHKMSVLVPGRRMIGVGDTHFPRFDPLQPHVGVLRDHANPSRRRTVNHEGLDELIVNI